MNHVDLFSGIGGFALAARWAGMTTVGFCELDPWCRRVLAKNFPGVPIHDDIRTLDAATVRGWGGADVLTGGFPCQPYSVAGQRRGANDDRALWPAMRRVIADVRPRWVLAENVAGFVAMGLDGVLADLEAEGYEAGALMVPACAVDALHRRDRIWIVAYADGGGRQAGVELPVPTGQPDVGVGTGAVADVDRDRQQQPTRRIAESGDGTGDRDPAPSYPDGWRHGSAVDAVRAGRNAVEHGGEPPADDDDAGRGEQRRFVAAEAEHATAERGCRWTPEPDVVRVVHGIPGRVDRLRGLGNAIVPQVAYEFFRLMNEEVAA